MTWPRRRGDMHWTVWAPMPGRAGLVPMSGCRSRIGFKTQVASEVDCPRCRCLGSHKEALRHEHYEPPAVPPWPEEPDP